MAWDQEADRSFPWSACGGAGKSSVGAALSARLGVEFVELDARVEAAAGMSLSGIFEVGGSGLGDSNLMRLNCAFHFHLFLQALMS